MIYNEFQNLKLPALGYGGMRLPVDEKTEKIDQEKVNEIVDYAMANGVNYFDTAFFYHAGESERALGEALSKYPRETWFLANKFPGNFIEYKDGKLHMDVTAMGMEKRTYNTAKEVFERQLDNCGVEYFDFYMLHNVAETTYDLYTDEEFAIVDYLLEEKRAGRIKHFGFSAHGRYETIDKFLDHYSCFEFTMIQLNYLDWTLQEAGKKYEVITKHNVPVFIMEPVRGGLLAAPGKDAEALLKAARPNDTPASWAFRFVQSLPNACTTISGMTTMEQLAENIETYNNPDLMPESEKKILEQVVDGMASFIPCTSCRYCCGICPKQLDIPMLIATYNEADHGLTWYVEDVLSSLADDKKPQACIACGVCNPLCPQDIDIPDVLTKFCKLLEDKKGA
ncbi:MAG: aldo/keto reductase [Oscillospiraceae bacterium]|nr:aldo/keto reductase [Oscillospiraceae bacterium]